MKRHKFLLIMLLTICCGIFNGCSTKKIYSTVAERKNYSILNDFTLVSDNSNGTKTMEIYTYPVAYLGDNSNFYLIDNSIVEVTNKNILSAGYTHQNKSNRIEIYFPEIIDGTNDIKIIDKEFFMMVTPIVNGSVVEYRKVNTLYKTGQDALVYESIYDNVDLLIYPTALGIKTQININGPVLEDSFVFGLICQKIW